jgi:protoporphyrinogen oxidase
MKQVYIIGAGVSGLVAAIELEKAGFAPIILEGSSSIGGRVRSDLHHGLPLDYGFQVLLSKYPATQRYLDFPKLQLHYFKPGAVIFRKGKRWKIGDPLRDPSFLFPTLFSGAGTLLDKWRIFRLSQELKRTSLDTIFQEPAVSTMDYLRQRGFSERIIHHFFRPFFAGIFLEKELSTSSRMFRFVYKMFSEGHAVIPQAGMQAIPDQLQKQLKHTEIRFNQPVASVRNQSITLQDGTTIEAENILIATDLPTHTTSDQATSWNQCTNLYFEANKNILREPIIGLSADPNTLVNNFHYLTDLFKDKTEQEILSVTVVGNTEKTEQELIAAVKAELQTIFGIATGQCINCFEIRKALPVMDELAYEPNLQKVQLAPHLYQAGDHLANPSLNAAMESGKVAAQALIQAQQN